MAVELEYLQQRQKRTTDDDEIEKIRRARPNNPSMLISGQLYLSFLHKSQKPKKEEHTTTKFEEMCKSTKTRAGISGAGSRNRRVLQFEGISQICFRASVQMVLLHLSVSNHAPNNHLRPHKLVIAQGQSLAHGMLNRNKFLSENAGAPCHFSI